MTNPLYTLRRVRKDDMRYGPVHGANDDHVTLCGQTVDGTWWIETNDHSGTVTCKRCSQAASYAHPFVIADTMDGPIAMIGGNTFVAGERGETVTNA